MVTTIIAKDSFDGLLKLLYKHWDCLAKDGSFFAMCQTEYDDAGNVRHDFLELIHAAVRFGCQYVNTIVYPAAKKQAAAFTDNACYIVWLCKDRSKMTFCKDAIREKHIWKDVEWGKRAKNYNPRGKDPGNVWIPTKDDGNAKITEHILLTQGQVIERLLAMGGHTPGGDKTRYMLHLGKTQCASWPGKPAASAKQALPVKKEAAGTVYFGTCETMDDIADGTVDVAVTSPPYWNLKDYFKDGQIGQEPYAQYLSRIGAVWRQCHGKLAAHGSLWININIRVKGNDVILLPYDFVALCREIGFLYKGIFIWHKSSGIPTNEKNIVDRHEYVLVFAKSDAFYFRKEVQASFADYQNENINGAAFWNINRKAGSVGKHYIHPAIYPNALAERIIRMTTDRGGMVLDPFLGSGTSMIAALACERNCIGYEYNEGFYGLMQHRFAKELENPGRISFLHKKI